MPLSYRLCSIAATQPHGNLHPAISTDVPELKYAPRKGVIYFCNIAP